MLVDKTLYVSGQLGFVPGKVAEMIGGGVKAEAEQSMKNIGEILKAAGGSYENGEKGIINVIWMFHFDFVIHSCEGHYSAGRHGRLSSWKNQQKSKIKKKSIKVVNDVYKSFFRGAHYPARAAYQVAALPKNGRVEIEAIAVIGQIYDKE